MPSDPISHLIGAIGQMLAAGAQGSSCPVLLHAEMRGGELAAATCRKSGSAVVCVDPGPALTRTVRSLWQAEQPAKRWTSMDYILDGNAIDTRFGFPDTETPGSPAERLERAVRQVFGDGPVPR